MKKSMLTITLALMIVATSAQEYTSRLGESNMKISGTSSLHDWESNVESFAAVATVSGETIQTVAFRAAVSSIKSGTSAMDANTYKALNESEHPNIEFKAGPLEYSGSSMPINGSLTIAGVTRKVEFKAVIEKWSEESMTIRATYPLKMTDYGIEPPKALMGTIKTGDEVTISFNITLYKK